MVYSKGDYILNLNEACFNSKNGNMFGDSLGSISDVLDMALDVAKECNENNDDDRTNPIFISLAGFGKTHEIYDWAAKSGVNLVYMKASGDETLLLGTPLPSGKEETTRNGDTMPVLKRAIVHELDGLDKPNSVLFIDEINRYRSDDVVNIMLGLIHEHKIPTPGYDYEEDGTKSNWRRFPNMLFTVSAINPADDNGSYVSVKKLDSALVNRMALFVVLESPTEWRDNFAKKLYLSRVTKYTQLKDWKKVTKWKGALAILDKLCSDKEFDFTGFEGWDSLIKANYKDQYKDAELMNSIKGMSTATSPRSLNMLFNAFDGTGASFIRLWGSYCDLSQLPIIKNILSDYIDVEDEEIKAFAGGTESKVLNDMGIKDATDLSSGNGRIQTAGVKALLNRMKNGDKGEF